MRNLCCVQLNDVAVEVPPGIPIYDMRTDLPWHYEPQSKWADMLERVAAADPDMLKMLEMEDYPPPYPGARSILRWETYMVRHCEAIAVDDSLCGRQALHQVFSRWPG
jgi:hypothetical protein